MEEIIEAINKLAAELLQDAQHLDTQLDEPAPDQAALKEQLHHICDALTKIVESLERDPSPLRKLVRMLDGSEVRHSLARLAQYIADHRSVLVKLRIPDTFIERVVVALTSQAEAGDNALDRPQTLRFEDAIDPLKSLRDLVCGIANAADVAEILATPAVLRQVVTATIGAAMVVVDVTGAVSAAPIDPVGWVLVKAVKSVWAGSSLVRGAFTEITGMLRSLRNAAESKRVEEEQARLRARSRNPKLKLKGSDGS